MKEVWKTIKNYPDYKVSNIGRIKSFKNKKERLLKFCLKSDGYFYVTLCANNTNKIFSIHRLLALAFIPNSDNKPQVNHKDGNKQNNHIDNLEWCTQSENEKHAHRIGLKNHKGSKNANSKLTDNKVLTIHGLYLSGFKYKEIAKIYNLHYLTIFYIINGKSWTHLL